MALTPQEVTMLVKEVIQESELPQALLARDSNLTPDALNHWMAGRRNPHRKSRHQLAEGLRKRAARLEELAERLDKAA